MNEIFNMHRQYIVLLLYRITERNEASIPKYEDAELTPITHHVVLEKREQEYGRNRHCLKWEKNV